MDEFQMHNKLQNANYGYQSALQAQEIQGQHALAAPYIQQQQQQVQAVLVEQINPDKIIEDLQLRLKGFIRKYDGSVIKLGLPLMNDKGIMTMMTFTSAVVNQGTVMSAFEKKEIARIMLGLLDTVINDLTLNWKQYGITNKSYLDIIHDMIMITCFSALNRGLSGGERKFLGTTTIENISPTPRIPQLKKEGFLSRFRI